jgi:unspecific monooxygenase
VDLPTPFIPPYPRVPAHELPLGEFLRAIRTNALTMWPERAYRDDFLVRSLLGRTNVLVNAPEAIHRVLLENQSNYRRSPASVRILRPITGQGLLLSDGELWRHQRRTIAPALAPRVMPMLMRHIVSATAPHMERLVSATEQPMDLLAEVQALALEVAGRSMFSLEMGQFGPPMRRMLAEFGADLSRPDVLDMVLPAYLPTWRDLRRRWFKARWMRLIEAVMDARLAQTRPLAADEAPRDLFDLLCAARDPETGEGFGRTALRDQVATLILAGHETTAVTLFWCLALLAQDQREQQCVAAEAEAVEITPETAFASLPQLVRARAVVQEALRLYPPAFVIVREAIGPDRLAGMDLPRRSVVMIAPWVLHRHERLWSNPLAFNPDRFMPDVTPPSRFAYLPFGAGPRVCVGAQFALTEVTLVLAMLIGRFAVSLTDARPILPTAVVTTQPDHAPKFRVRQRGSAATRR